MKNGKNLTRIPSIPLRDASGRSLTCSDLEKGNSMWICPKCGREFKRTNQDHYCGKAPENVDEYIARQNPEARSHLTELRSLLLRCVPGVTEKIAWSMPQYKKDGHVLSFAACKKHVSFYVDAEILERFRPQLSGFAIKKNALYLPYDQPLPLEVMEKMVREAFGVDGQIRALRPER